MQVVRLRHSTVLASGKAGLMLFDPFLIPEAAPKADVIFITHGHYDHFSPEDIKRCLKPGTVIVCPPSLMKECCRLAVTVKSVRGLEISTVAAYNIGKPFHKREDGGVGDIVSDGTAVLYVAGDTDITPEAQSVRCDICALPVGGKYTMDADEAAALARRIRPKIAIPTHYGDIDGVAKKEAAVRFAYLLPPEIKCECFPPL